MKKGQKVRKITGDYKFKGVVVAVFKKTGGQVRVVVENRDGILHIFNPSQLEKCKPPQRPREIVYN